MDAAWEQRFGGLRRLYGAEADRLAAAHVRVVGLGGVGSWAVEALARSGVGALTLVDGDEVCVTNVNRQLHALDGAVGRAKVELLAERVRAIHPGCAVRAEQSFFSIRNAEQLLAEPCDVVIDAIDGPSAKATLIGLSHARGAAVVTCGAAAGKVDPAQVQSADLALVHHDRLLMFTRKLLRKHHGYPKRSNKPFGIEAVFSPEPVRACEGAADTEGPACEGRLGSAVFVTAVFGFHAAARTVALLVQPPEA